MKAISVIVTCVMLSGFISPNPFQSRSKSMVRIYLECFRYQDKNHLSVRVITKPDKRYRPAKGVEVALYAAEISATTLLGKLLTSSNGTATYTFSQEQLEVAKKAKFAHYYAVVFENDTLQGKETEITIKKVNFNVRFSVKDSIKQIDAHVSETDSMGIEIPKEDVDIKFFVERPLNPLPVGDEYNSTDEKGNVSMEFPDDLPGDPEGFLKVIVRIVENEDYGTVEVKEVKQWGIPTSVSDDTAKRSLWASGANAPLALLIFINSLIASVWAMIFYIIYKVFVIRKLGSKYGQ